MRRSERVFRALRLDPSRDKRTGTPNMDDAYQLLWLTVKRCRTVAEASELLDFEISKRGKMLADRGWDVNFKFDVADFSGFVRVDNRWFRHVVDATRAWTPDGGYTEWFPTHRYELNTRGYNIAVADFFSPDVKCDGDAEDVMAFLLANDEQRLKRVRFVKHYPCNAYDGVGTLKSDEYMRKVLDAPHTICMQYSLGGGGGGPYAANTYKACLLFWWAMFRMLDVQPAAQRPASELNAEIPVSEDRYAKRIQAELDRLRNEASALNDRIRKLRAQKPARLVKKLFGL